MLNRTIGVIIRDELDWVIEDHTEGGQGEIRVTCAELTAARVHLGASGLLGPIEAEPEWAHPVERMDLLLQDISDLLAAEAKAGRGPWADLEIR